jgi:hypothetical protein
VATTTETTRHGTTHAAAWDRLHPRLTRRGGWEHHDGELPIVEGSMIKLEMDRTRTYPAGASITR